MTPSHGLPVHTRALASQGAGRLEQSRHPRHSPRPPSDVSGGARLAVTSQRATDTTTWLQNLLAAPEGDTAPLKQSLSSLVLPPNLPAPADLLSVSTDLPTLHTSHKCTVQNVTLGTGFTRAAACVNFIPFSCRVTACRTAVPHFARLFIHRWPAGACSPAGDRERRCLQQPRSVPLEHLPAVLVGTCLGGRPLGHAGALP